jgi:predicted ABC-type ATPase
VLAAGGVFGRNGSTGAAAPNDNLRMPALIVITGPPGAGKSTIAPLVSMRSSPSVLIEGDAFFAFLDQGAIAPWLPESHSQNAVVTRAAAAAAGHFASTYTTIYDGVVGPWFLDAFVADTGIAAVHYLILLPSIERCVERVLTRTGHGFVDEAAARKMHGEFSQSPIAERHVYLDPPESPDVVAAEVLARFSAGDLIYAAPSSRA